MRDSHVNNGENRQQGGKKYNRSGNHGENDAFTRCLKRDSSLSVHFIFLNPSDICLARMIFFKTTILHQSHFALNLHDYAFCPWHRSCLPHEYGPDMPVHHCREACGRACDRMRWACCHLFCRGECQEDVPPSMVEGQQSRQLRSSIHP